MNTVLGLVGSSCSGFGANLGRTYAIAPDHKQVSRPRKLSVVGAASLLIYIYTLCYVIVLLG